MPHSSHVSFFFNDTATTEIYTLSLHDALPIYSRINTDDNMRASILPPESTMPTFRPRKRSGYSSKAARDRKSTRLNSSHVRISYAVFCLKKKTKTTKQFRLRIAILR